MRSVRSVHPVRSSVRSVHSVESAALRPSLFNALNNGRTLPTCSAHRERWSRLPPEDRVPRRRRPSAQSSHEIRHQAVRLLSPRLLGTRALTRRAGLSFPEVRIRIAMSSLQRAGSTLRPTPPRVGHRLPPDVRSGPGPNGESRHERHCAGVRAIGAGVNAGSHVSLGVVPKVASMCSRQRAFSRRSPPIARHQAGVRRRGSVTLLRGIIGCPPARRSVLTQLARRLRGCRHRRGRRSREPSGGGPRHHRLIRSFLRSSTPVTTSAA